MHGLSLRLPNRLFEAKLLVRFLIDAHFLVVREVAKSLVHKPGDMAHELQRPAKSGNKHATLVVSLGDKRDDFASIAVLRILRPEGAAFAVFNHQADELHEVSNVEHATLVRDFRKNGEFLGELAQKRIVAPAALAENHGRAENHDLERIAVERTKAIFSLDFAIAVAVRGVYRGIARNELFLADGSAVAIHDGTAHEHKLLHAGFFCLGRTFYGEVRIDGVIEFCTFLADFSVVAVGDSRHMIDSVVLAEIVATPSVANHVERIDFVLADKFRLSKVVGKAHADVAVRASD